MLSATSCRKGMAFLDDLVEMGLGLIVLVNISKRKAEFKIRFHQCCLTIVLLGLYPYY
jgi:uncharacterized membrane protein